MSSGTQSGTSGQFIDVWSPDSWLTADSRGDSRCLTFGNGMTIREIIVDIDNQRYRHSWSARGEPFTHHNASLQVFAEDEQTCRIVWIADVMPNEITGKIAEMIEQALHTMKATLEA